MNTKNEVEVFKEECRAKERVCPVPMKWNDLFKLIKRKTDKKGLALPLILAAWHDTPNLLKMMRFEEHIKFAYDNGEFENIKRFLDNLTEEQWHHLKD